MRLATCFLFVLTSACGLGTKAPLATCPDDAETLNFQLTEIGYLERDVKPQVFTDDEAWQAYVGEQEGSDTAFGGTIDFPSVDFATQVVFTNSWVDGGCEDSPTYAVCGDGDAVTAYSEPGHDDDCDGYFPQVDVLVVDRGEATTFEWSP